MFTYLCTSTLNCPHKLLPPKIWHLCCMHVGDTPICMYGLILCMSKTLCECVLWPRSLSQDKLQDLAQWVHSKKFQTRAYCMGFHLGKTVSVIESLSVATTLDCGTVVLCLMQLTTHQMIVVLHWLLRVAIGLHSSEGKRQENMSNDWAWITRSLSHAITRSLSHAITRSLSHASCQDLSWPQSLWPHCLMY